MKTLTFAFDVQFNDKEDWIPEGTKVNVSENEFHLSRWKDAAPVIIKEILSYKGKRIEIDPTVEWFSNNTFVELRRNVNRGNLNGF